LGYRRLARKASYTQFNLIYAPPSGRLQIAVQATNSSLAPLPQSVWVDNLTAEPYELAEELPVTLDVEGSFDFGVNGLIRNINNMDGEVTSFFESEEGIAMRLSIKPDQLAANLGTTVTDINGSYPASLLGRVNVKRESALGGGMLGFILTNRFRNIALFRLVDGLPGPESENEETLLIGGDFNAANPNTPIHIIVQNGGPGVDSSIIVDDMSITKINE